jgi:hypothetical protein
MRTLAVATAMGISLLLAGCQTRAQAIDDHATAAMVQLRADAQSQLMQESCADGAAIGPNCGLVVKRIAMDDFRASFREKKCGGAGDDACQAKLFRAIDAWLDERYPLADFLTINAQCDAAPDRCDAVAYEKMLLDSQNDALQLRAAHFADTIEERREQAHEVEMSKGAGAQIADSLGLTNLTCASPPLERSVTVCTR